MRLPKLGHVIATSMLLAACHGSSSTDSTNKPADKKTPPASDKKPPAAAAPDAAPAPKPTADNSKAAGYTTTTIALPGGGADGVGMDYLLYDPRTKAVWVPAGNSGSVDVIDTTTGDLKRIEGFPTKEMERHGKKRIVGPSSATLGEGTTVYIGSRGDFTVCAIDEVKLAKGACGTLDSMPDGIAYVAKTKEVWVTTPRDKTIRVLDGATLKEKAKLTFDGDPEGFAVDEQRGRFYTNLEDKDETLAIDLESHKTVATWKPECGEEGPHGLRLDGANGLLFIACSTKAKVMDVAKDGAILSSLDTGDGVDDLDFDASARKLYVGGAKAGTLTIASVGPHGELAAVAVVPTSDGARNGVVDAGGKVYLAHSKGGELVVATPPAAKP
jgi:DNA-binding beta-propeller fold protein YncE